MNQEEEFSFLRDKLELKHVAPPWEAERLSRITNQLPPEPEKKYPPSSRGRSHQRNRRRNKGLGQKRRTKVYIRDMGMCKIQGPLCAAKVSPGVYRQLSIEEATVDHIVPHSRGGSSHGLNLQCACVPCNNWKGNSTMQELEPLLRLLREMEAQEIQ